MHSILPRSIKTPFPPEYALPVLLETGHLPAISDQRALRLVNKQWCDLTTKTIEFMDTIRVGTVREFLMIFQKQLDGNFHAEEITQITALGQTLEERRDNQPLFGPRWHEAIIETTLKISLSALGKTPFRFAEFNIAPHRETIPRPVRNCEFELRESSRDSTIEKGASIEEIQAPFSIVESRGFDALKFAIPDRAGYRLIRIPIFPHHLSCPQSEFKKVYSQIWNVATAPADTLSEISFHTIDKLEALATIGHFRIARVAVQSFLVRHREKHASLNTFSLEKRLLMTISYQMHSKGDAQGARQILLNFNAMLAEQEEYLRNAYIPLKHFDSLA